MRAEAHSACTQQQVRKRCLHDHTDDDVEGNKICQRYNTGEFAELRLSGLFIAPQQRRLCGEAQAP